MAVDFLLEIGTEEIPAGFMSPALKQLEAMALDDLTFHRLDHGELKVFGTPRRTVLWVQGVAERQLDAVEQKVGPPVRAAFDADGNPTRAGEGFARANGVAVEDLLQVDTDKGRYVAVRLEIAGRPAAEVLAERVVEWICKLHYPKSMRWGSGEVAFVRPLHWIVALLGAQVVPCAHAGVSSGRTTRGHRFHHPEPIEVADPADYFRRLEKARVVVDPAERRRRIVEGVRAVAEGWGCEPLLDDDLLETVTHLVEWPVPVGGTFEAPFLELPRELLILTMKHHQKYFAVVDAEGHLANHFVAVSNTEARDMAVVGRGNERVLRARLADARFFYDEDRKQSLETLAEGLKKVVFQVNLGTSWEKVERFRSLAGKIAAELCPDRLDVVDRIALLAKADLESQMVYEFPELQGIAGREYALRAGEAPEVARGIQEHYWPTQAGGDLPRDPEADCVSLADKLDTVVGCFGVGLVPTGTADPYALRRQTLGVLRILLEKGYRLRVTRLVDLALAGLGDKLTRPSDEVRAQVLGFVRGRLEGFLIQQGNLPADLVLAVLDGGWDDPVDARKRVAALERAQADGTLAPLAETFKRVGNISKKASASGAPDPGCWVEEAEEALWASFERVRDAMAASVRDGDYDRFLARAGELKGAVDRFFDDVLVMDPDPHVRANRLALLGAVGALFGGVAEFSRIGGRK